MPEPSTMALVLFAAFGWFAKWGYGSSSRLHRRRGLNSQLLLAEGGLVSSPSIGTDESPAGQSSGIDLAHAGNKLVLQARAARYPPISASIRPGR